MESGFQVRSIFLLESYFERLPFIEANEKTNEIALKRDYYIGESILTAIVELTFRQRNKKTKKIELRSKIKMAGEFIFEKNTSITIEDFAKVNAPAIIFPFIREHLANLSLRAGIPPILLPPVNFVRLSDESKNK
ncbi:protein-export chaperone SecB [Raineya sp.]|jgi:preprotein translocase subunit SecB